MVKKVGFLETDNLEAIDYNHDVILDDIATVGHKNDTHPNDLNNDIEKIDLKKTSATQKAAKKVIKKYKNLKRKGQHVNYSNLNKKRKDDGIAFIKQVPVHPRDRFKKLAVIDEKVEFIKQVPVHPRDRLRRAKKQQQEKVEFIKQFPIHPRDRFKKATNQQAPIHPWDRLKKLDKNFQHPKNRVKNKEGEIPRDNVSNLMRGELNFDPKEILNKTLLFDTKKIDEEIIMDKITEALKHLMNDEFYNEHPVGSNAFTLKREDGR